MNATKLFAVSLVLLGGLTARAQELPRGEWWQRPELVRELGLSPEQRQRLDQIFRTSAPELIDLKAALDKKGLALRGAIDRPELDRDAIRSAGSELSAARARLFERELMMLVDMRGVLDEAQWNRFRRVIEAHRQRGRSGVRPGLQPPGRGPGGRRPRPN
ncbi:MAG TPA: periplasmic heavy metal sensor [Thermoanaerobaculia bacterium]|nr:periplasmic heavy metal sensor [Thermoanaerobaculia bacterium]